MFSQECPVQCAICVPASNFRLKDGSDLELKGYAYSGGGRGIVRVDVSLDGGDTWQNAELEPTTQSAPKEFGWRLWSFSLSHDQVKKAANGSKELVVVAKATDSSHNVMPRDVESIWNLRGIMNNSWHKIKVELC